MKTLLLIDIQQGFDSPFWGTRNNPELERNVEKLLEYARHKQWAIIHVQHSSLSTTSPLNPNQAGFHFKKEAEPMEGEKIFQKHVNSAFIGTNLDEYLKQQHLSELVIAGLTTDHCVSTTVRMAANLGYNVTLVEDAVATFNRVGMDGKTYSAEDIHAIHIASLHDEFCQVCQSRDLCLR